MPVGLLFKRCRSFLFNNGGLFYFPPMSLLHNYLFFISMIIKFFSKGQLPKFFFQFFLPIASSVPPLPSFSISFPLR
nr:MAG TPA: hypothetical protein [Siphoviridae sp. ctweK11]DAN14054.1 MAG TPA: hypothetical protein [Caudoviricetes sp.]